MEKPEIKKRILLMKYQRDLAILAKFGRHKIESD